MSLLAFDWIHSLLSDLVSDIHVLCRLTPSIVPLLQSRLSISTAALLETYLDLSAAYNESASTFPTDPIDLESLKQIAEECGEVVTSICRVLRHERELLENVGSDKNIVKTLWFKVCDGLFELVGFFGKRLKRIEVENEDEFSVECRMEQLQQLRVELEERELKGKDDLILERNIFMSSSLQNQKKIKRLTLEISQINTDVGAKSEHVSKTLEEELKIEDERHGKILQELVEEIDLNNKKAFVVAKDHLQREIDIKKKIERLEEEAFIKKQEFESGMDASSQALKQSQELLNAEVESLHEIKLQLKQAKQENAESAKKLRQIKGTKLLQLKKTSFLGFSTYKADMEELAVIIIQKFSRGFLIRKRIKQWKSSNAGKLSDLSVSLGIAQDPVKTLGSPTNRKGSLAIGSTPLSSPTNIDRRSSMARQIKS